MSKQTDLVFAGFIRLTEAEQKELINQIHEYLNASKARRTTLDENVLAKVNLGPLNRGGCPCCGK